MRIVDEPPTQDQDLGPAPTDPVSGVGGGPIDLIEAVHLFSMCGSLADVARQLRVPIYELKKISRTQPWLDELHELRVAELAQLNVTLTSILDETLSQLSDRVHNGNEIMGADGKSRFVPLSASELTRVADVVFDKRQLVRDQPTAILSGDSTNKKLEKLAMKLRALGAKDVSLLSEKVETIEPPKSEADLRSAHQDPDPDPHQDYRFARTEL